MREKYLFPKFLIISKLKIKIISLNEENMRPKIFIGSSTENLITAHAIQVHLDDVSEPSVWKNGIFKLSDYPLNSLVDKLQNSDFGVFVFSPDDNAIIRDQKMQTVRDNTIFELGLCIGHLGKERSFIVSPKGVDAFHIPTDLIGIKHAKYDSQRENIEDALGPACNEIRNAIEELGLRHSEQEENIIRVSTGDESIFENLNNANSIDIMANTSRTFFGKYIRKMTNAIANNGCRVRILLSNPENEIWNYECVNEGLCPGLDIKNEIEQVKNILKNKMDVLKEHKPSLKAGSIELKMYSNLPTCSIIIINNEIARHTPYLPLTHSGEVPNYDVTKEGRIFKEYQDVFQRVWEKSTSETVVKMDFGSNQ